VLGSPHVLSTPPQIQGGRSTTLHGWQYLYSSLPERFNLRIQHVDSMELLSSSGIAGAFQAYCRTHTMLQIFVLLHKGVYWLHAFVLIGFELADKLLLRT
jgi:hypothetical protein